MVLPARGDAGHSWHMFQVLIDFAARGMTRPGFQKAMADRGIGIGVHYPSIPSLKFYREAGYRDADTPVAARVGRETVTLPLFPAMADEDVARVVQRDQKRAEMKSAGASTLQTKLAPLAGHIGDGADCLPPWLISPAKECLIMKRLMILALGGAVFAAPLYAALAPGAHAPDFTTAGDARRQAIYVFLGRCAEERSGGAVLLSGGIHAGLHRRGA